MKTVSSDFAGELSISTQRVREITDQVVFDCDKKEQWCRDFARDYISSLIVGRDLKLFCIPGTAWEFETELFNSDRWNIVNFTAVESNRVAFHRGIVQMPGTRKRFWKVATPSGEFDCYCNEEESYCFHTNLTRLLCASRLFGGTHPLTRDEISFWNKIKVRHNAFWFDTCNTLSPQTLLAISRIYSFAELRHKRERKFNHRIPVIVTFMRGRDMFHSDAERKEAFVIAGNTGKGCEYRLTKWINYTGIGGAPMCMAAGYMEMDVDYARSQCKRKRKSTFRTN